MNAWKFVFSDVDPFKVIAVDNLQDQVCIYVQSTSCSGVCPRCRISSTKIHSYYSRKLSDLPAFGKVSYIFLRSRKFYCRQDACSLRIFTERFSDHFQPYKRRTNRLEEKTRQLGLLSGGKPAERICELMSIPISDTTILRLVKKSALPAAETVTAVGVDDWAFKKRDSYGTILVDLTTGKAIDLLPDREEATLTKWLEQRPEIKLLSEWKWRQLSKLGE